MGSVGVVGTRRGREGPPDRTGAEDSGRPRPAAHALWDGRAGTSPGTLCGCLRGIEKPEVNGPLIKTRKILTKYAKITRVKKV